MSASTLTTPVRPAIKPWYSHLLFDPWIGLSWLVFAGTGLMSLLLMLAPHPQPTTPPATTHATPRSQVRPAPVVPVAVTMVKPHVTFTDAAGRFIFTGYVFWSLYFGWAACWRLMTRAALRFFNTAGVGIVHLLGGGCLWMISFGGVLFGLGAIYSCLGGGLLHFLRRWWLLAHGRQPPFLRSANRTEAVNERLARLDELWHNGYVTRPEYDQQRRDILRDL